MPDRRWSAMPQVTAVDEQFGTHKPRSEASTEHDDGNADPQQDPHPGTPSAVPDPVNRGCPVHVHVTPAIWVDLGSM
jgi:hypothetical protein